jgi:predicted DsbA family dithiol-disulfide isomerase
MHQIEVFADIACPFAHAGLRAFTAYRRGQGASEPRLVVRAWPLEIVNDTPHSGRHLAPEIDALREGPAPDLFAGFQAEPFPGSTMAALASSAAAYRAGVAQGEAFSLAVRDALWEHGLDVDDPEVLAELRRGLRVPDPTDEDEAAVHADLAEGRARGVDGSPHFFTDRGDFFCPSLDIGTEGGHMRVRFDPEEFRRFVVAAFA